MTTTHYRVRWEIDIEADSPEEAALKAQAIQRKRDSIATVFDVRTEEPSPPGDWKSIDFNPDDGQSFRIAVEYSTPGGNEMTAYLGVDAVDPQSALALATAKVRMTRRVGKIRGARQIGRALPVGTMQVVCGNGVVVGPDTDDENGTQDPTITLDELKDEVTWRP